MDYKKRCIMLAVSIIGCVSTYYLNHGLGLGAVLASALVGLVGGLLLKKHAGLNYAATFAGMNSLSVIPSIYLAALLGILVFIVYIGLEKYFKGIGGKLGTIAMIASLIITIGNPLIDLSAWSGINVMSVLLIMITGIIGVLLTFYIRKGITKNTVIASAGVGLIAAMMRTNLSLVLYSASFAGMASKKKVPTRKAQAIVGLLVGGFYILLLGIFPGIGGKLGFIGFCSVLAYNKLIRK